MQKQLFKKSSMERFSSPEKLNDFIQVANPSSWMVLLAALALLLGVLIWGVFGSLTESLTFNGIVRGGELGCFVSAEGERALQAGMAVTIAPLSGAQEPFEGVIASVSEHPLSYAEASAGIQSDYLLSALGVTTWNTVVTISTDAEMYEGVVYAVTAVTDVRRPIDLVFQ